MKREDGLGVGVKKWVGWNFCGWIRIKGVMAFESRAEHAALYCREDDILELVREPENPYDKNAIMILHRADQIGYVDRHLAKTLQRRFVHSMPIRALFKRGYVGESGAIAIDILPQMPSAEDRRKSNWEKTK